MARFVFFTRFPAVLPRNKFSLIELLLAPTITKSISSSASITATLSETLPFAEINLISTFFISQLFTIVLKYKLVSRSIIASTFIIVPAFV